MPDGTKLSKTQELKYNKWKSKLPTNLQYEGDYDLRGLWKSNPNIKPSSNLHFPDTYKLPNHPTFSNESIYFNPQNRSQAGHWDETDSSFNYIPYDPMIKDTIIERKADGGPIEEDKPKKKLSANEIKKKYNNQYVSAGREQWGEYLEDKKLPFSGTSLKQAIYKAASSSKLNPQLLYTSAMEEGLREGIDNPNTISEAYSVAIGDIPDPITKKTKEEFDPTQYPVDGFRTYGLDTFGDQYESLKKKGYLPENFDTRFKKFKALNEQDKSVNSAAFKTEDDALLAKAAMLRSTRDNLENYVKKNNLPLTDKQRDFFNLVGYNAGEGNMQKMIKSYKDKGYLKNDEFLTNPKFKPASYLDPYTYAQRRLTNANVLTNEGYFEDYQPIEDQTQMNNGGIMNNYFNNGGGLSRDKDYGSKKKPYPSVSSGDFAGDGRSYPIPTKADAIDALRLAGLHHRSDVKAKVYKKYPELKKNLGGIIPLRDDVIQPYAKIANFGDSNNDSEWIMANSGIHINPANKGKFNATKKATGKTTEELTHSKNPLTRKRAIFAQNASHWNKGANGLNLPFEPRIIEDEDELNIAKNNISNYFTDPNNNQVINDASMSTNNDYQGQNYDFSQEGQDSSSSNTGSNIARNIAGAIPTINSTFAIQGTAAIMNLANRGKQENEEFSRRVRRSSQQDVYNPIRYGTGSQAIYNNGGSIEGISDNQFSSPIYQFNGPSHEDGGIKLDVNGQPIEVEGGETIFKDNTGDLNVFGNMYVPGTNKKFKTVSKNIADIESKTQRNLDKSVDLVNNNEPTSRYQKYSFNAGKVMMGSNTEKLQELDQIKNELSGMQNLMLEQGFKEDSSENLKKMKNGGKIDKYAVGGDLFDNGRRKKTSTNRRTPAPTIVDMLKPTIDFNTPYNPPQGRLSTIDPNALNEYIPNDPNITTPEIQPNNPLNPPRTNAPGRPSSFPLSQVLPELLTVATERPEFVPGQTYEPNLYTPYQVSFQDRLNENNAAFRAIQQTNANDPSALAQIAAQKYEANNRVLADEFRTNQGITNQITNQNTELLNQAKLQNIQLTDQQMVRQSQARSNTRQNIMGALNSISGKVAQANLEDQTLAVYENMFPHFTYDDSGKLEFQNTGKNPVFGSGSIGNSSSSPYQRSKVEYDKNGNIKKTTVNNPSQADQSKLDLQIQKAQTQKLGLFNSIFGGRKRRK